MNGSVKPFHYLMPTQVVAGSECLNELGQRTARLGNRALVVTGRHSARCSGALECVESQLVGATLFEGVEENPTTDTCERGAKVCRQAKSDFVVALGGGSAMDTAKAIAVLASNDGPCSRYFGGDAYLNPPLPIVAVPTTAGTGSEVTPYAVLVDSATHTKRTIAGKTLFPRLALLDPTITVTMPRAVTIHTGLDALSQAMEGMVSRSSTPMGDVLALETCRIVAQWLPIAADEPGNLDARMQMLYAAMLSGCVIAQSGTTLVHGMGYALTLEFGVPHGLANGLLLAPLFAYNAQWCPETVASIAQALGGTDIAEVVYALFRRLGISAAGRDYGIDESRLHELAEAISADRSRFKNQPGQPDVDEVERFYRTTWYGWC